MRSQDSPDDPADADATGESAPTGWWVSFAQADLTTRDSRTNGRYRMALVASVITVALLAVLLWRTRTLGHWWGDDWALYIRQANALLDLNPSRVATSNLFTVTNSAGAPFSPPVYPWGYSAVLALAIPFLGSGVDDLAIIGVVAAAVFAASWYLLARVRLGNYAAIVAMVAVCFTATIASWSDLVQSEFVFMAAVGIFVWRLDVVVRQRSITGDSASLASLFALGLLAGVAFEIRREGLATIAAIGAAQLVIVIDTWSNLRRQPQTELRRTVAQLAMPYAGFALFVGAIKFALPAVLVPRYEGAGVANVITRFDRHIAHVADLIGIKVPSAPAPEIFNSTTLGWALLICWATLLAIGIAMACSVWRRDEAHLAAYVIVAFIIGGSAKAALSRYFATVVPVASLLVLTVVAASMRALIASRRRQPPHRRRRAAVYAQIAVAVVALPFAYKNTSVLISRGDTAGRLRAMGIYQWGAQDPEAQRMFAWIRQHTSPNDVVGSFKARSMVLETGRAAIQVDDYRPLNPRVPVAVVVLERTGTRAARFRADPGWTSVWRSERLEIFAPTDSALAQRR